MKLLYLSSLFSILFLTVAQAQDLLQARQILKKLYESRGDYRLPIPDISIERTENAVARYLPSEHRIIVEQKAVEICRQLGPDYPSALAFLIGHELAHSYQSPNSATAGFSTSINRYPASIRREKIADIQGAMNTHLAGYPIRRMIPTLLNRLYESYQIESEQLRGYPHLVERMNTAEEIVQLTDTLIQVFEAGHWLAAMGLYELASKAYEYVKEYYAGKEILNNLASLYCLRAMAIGGKQNDPFLLPLTFDTQSRLQRPRVAPLRPEEIALRKKYLQTAHDYLAQAKEIDPEYSPALINDLCVRVLKGMEITVVQQYQAWQKMETYRQVTASQKDRLSLAAGVAYALTANELFSHKQEAVAIFKRLSETAASPTREMAAVNLSIMQDTKYRPVPPLNCHIPSPTANLVSPFQYRRQTGFSLDSGGRARLWWLPVEEDTLYLARWQGRPVFWQKSRQLSPEIQSYFELLSQNYQPETYFTSRGNLLHFTTCKTIFHLDASGQILSWIKIF